MKCPKCGKELDFYPADNGKLLICKSCGYSEGKIDKSSNQKASPS
jgi:Zn ribbon nucleic-acid-binding protein